jgi:hypothetical protein
MLLQDLAAEVLLPGVACSMQLTWWQEGSLHWMWEL